MFFLAADPPETRDAVHSERGDAVHRIYTWMKFMYVYTVRPSSASASKIQDNSCPLLHINVGHLGLVPAEGKQGKNQFPG